MQPEFNEQMQTQNASHAAEPWLVCQLESC